MNLNNMGKNSESKSNIHTWNKSRKC